MPALHYWFSGAALFLLLSFGITVIIGIIPMIDGKKRISIFILLGIGFFVAALGWWVAAGQEQKSDHQAHQLADLLVKMNTLLGQPPNTALGILSPSAPKWVKVAYDQLGQKEIAGPQENPQIVAYFHAIDANPHRDDLEDWASAFVEWSFNSAGISGPKSHDPFAWLEWGQRLSRPVFGCVVVLSFSGLRHVGFYFGDEDGFVRVLGGNEDDAVHVFRYPKTSVLDYRWPPKISIPEN